jgi:hypothetical protein
MLGLVVGWRVRTARAHRCLSSDSLASTNDD